MRLPHALREQARACASLDSPFMERLLTVLADHMPRDSRLFDKANSWEGDLGPSHASLPLRLTGGLHALVLSKSAPDLARIYPPAHADDADFTQTVLAALEAHQDFLLDWIDRPPQTNEIRRSGPLIAAAHVVAARYNLPLAISELGASGGLNLMFDHYALDAGGQTLGPNDPALRLAPDWTGPVPAPSNVIVADRRGVDLTPLNPRDDADALRLRAYLWADQPHRQKLTQAAIAVFDAQVDAGDAVEWLAQRLTHIPRGRAHLVYHTVAWQYFPPEAQRAGQLLLERAGAAATDDAPLAWFSMETDNHGRGAGLTLRLWPGDVTLSLGRSDFHGRWVDWRLT